MTEADDLAATRPGRPGGELTMGGLMADPDRLGTYARLREDGPVSRCLFFDGNPLWLVTRYEDAKAVLSDPRLASDSSKHGRMRVTDAHGLPENIARYFNGNMLDSDPPEHTRLRGLVSRSFTARRIADLRPAVERIVDRLIDDAAERERRDGHVDLVDVLADPLPLSVLCELLGVPDDHRHRWAAAAKDLTAMGPDVVAAAGTLVELAKALVDLKRARPGADLISDLIRARDDSGDRLSEDELVTTAITVLGSGNESTVQLIAAGTFHLLSHPEQAAALADDPALLPGAVEEFLRYFNPFELSGVRFTTEPVTIGGADIPAGEAVLVVLAAADRDPRVFAEPDRVDFSRPDGRGHLAFGHGIHYCLGAPLGRMQAEVAIGTLWRRRPRVALTVPAERISWRAAFVSGPGELPVRLGPEAEVGRQP
ncbi:cytochrome P450 [Saccharothrix ecbatanensis]|uniref:Cytochrome P450 n=1 Tax=Saccharothrix ecbatanensis TaxID=1105145 RepID=A0A7W9HHD3_9PSEU|nr:cytochrome P450 [Saccharothrix ecbatanensis]MBB5802230.1 cytochrome P450 [Saccharothrix ecbatanensis]